MNLRLKYVLDIELINYFYPSVFVGGIHQFLRRKSIRGDIFLSFHLRDNGQFVSFGQMIVKIMAILNQRASHFQIMRRSKGFESGEPQVIQKEMFSAKIIPQHVSQILHSFFLKFC